LANVDDDQGDDDQGHYLTREESSYLFVGQLTVFAHRDDVVQQVGIPLITTTTRSVEKE